MRSGACVFGRSKSARIIVVDVRHRRRVDGERVRPAVVDAERAEALPEPQRSASDGEQEHRAPTCSIDPGSPVQGLLNCD